MIRQGREEYYFFYFGFMDRQDYFTHFEISQSYGRTKNGRPPEKKHLTTLKQNLVCLTWPERDSNTQWWAGLQKTDFLPVQTDF